MQGRSCRHIRGAVGLELSRTQRLLIGGAIAVCVIAIIVSLLVSGDGDDNVTMGNAPPYHGAENKGAAMMVHVVGQVQRPGVYKLPAGSRVRNAVVAAGGFTRQADRDAVNLASFITDGAKIQVPRLEARDGRRSADHGGREMDTGSGSRMEPKASERSESRSPTPPRRSSVPRRIYRRQRAREERRGGSGAGGVKSNKQHRPRQTPQEGRTDARGREVINVNTATAKELQKLDGIGPVLASRIVEYRRRHGYFRNTAGLKAVEGIGPETVKDIAPRISLQQRRRR